MQLSPEKLREFLVEPGHISEEDFNKALEESKQTGRSLKQTLIGKDLISDKQLGQVIADEFGYLFVDLKKEAIEEKVLKIVPEVVAKNQRIIAFDRNEDGLKVAMNDPSDLEMISWLKKKTGEEIKPYYATEADIENSLGYYNPELQESFEEIIKKNVEDADSKTGIQSNDVPVIKIVDTIIEYAHRNRASDIHIEPLKDVSQVRFRIDGILHKVLTVPKNIHSLLIARIKVLAGLKTDEHFQAQDGKFQVEVSTEFSGEESFDIRVSIVPVTKGENAVLRLLSEKSRRLDLKDLGLSSEALKKLKETSKASHGMILSTGPTGSGKTTTLYAILKILNKPEVNISTIEDPVEYDIQGINQIQVNPDSNLTFARGLRSIVRQDPDIIMVGEIRDDVTANIAVNSAMTGHLVLSTMHANTAATNLPRLMDMGIEPFLVASSVNLIVAQRLVRRICTKCRYSKHFSKEDLEKMGFSEEKTEKLLKGKDSVRIYKGKGCKACNDTGYSGRVGIFEILEIKDNIRNLIMKKANADQIEKQAQKNGMKLMIDDGFNKVKMGITTLEEVQRVTAYS